MSDTMTPKAAASAPLSADLKSAVLAAADAHFAAVSADVTRLKGAVSSDLTGLATSGTSEFERLETSVVAEIARLRADLTGATPRIYLLAAVLAVASAAAVVGHFVVHLF